MKRLARLALLVSLVSTAIGCDRKPTATPTTHAHTDVETIRVGATEDDGPTVHFTVTAVYPDHAPAAAAPFHKPGGNWTFFDCAFADAAGGPIPFTVGVNNTPAAKGAPVAIGWGKAALTTADRAIADRFLKHLALGLKTTYPPARKPTPLQPATFTTAVLGEHIARGNGGGGFGNQAGTWNATKWFTSLDGIEAEIFFNYDLTTRQGEFSEKDEDYDADVLAVLAIALRDGPRPPRTPQTDPNLTDAGPKLGPFRAIPDSSSATPEFTPNSKLLLIAKNIDLGPGILYTAPPDSPASQTEIARVERHLSQVITNDPGARQLILEETLQKEPHTFAGDDPVRLWHVDRDKNTRRQLTGPWGERGHTSSQKCLSPDSRYLSISAQDQMPPHHTRLHFLDLRSGTATTAAASGESLTLVAWTTHQNAIRAILRTGFVFDRDKPHDDYEFDPGTGALTKLATADLPIQALPGLAPDAALRFTIRPKQSLSLIDLVTKSQRTFTFHEDDQRLVEEESFHWLTPRYIFFEGSPRPAVIDARTLKMSYLHSDFKGSLTFSPDFTWAIRSTEGDHEIAPILPAPD